MADPEAAIQEPQAQKPGAPTLHHLNNSQSQRILWLLEELGIEYNLKLYERTKGQRAPPELSSIHPLGKSPILATPSGEPLIESSAIITYLLKTYDTAGRFTASDLIRDETLTSFAGATLGPIMAVQLFAEVLPKASPWPISTIMRGVKANLEKLFSKVEFEKNVKYLEGELGDKEWFNGEMLGRSDVMLSFPLDQIAHRGWVDFERDFPKLGAWRKRISEREAWKTGLVKGNGYDMRVF